METPEECVNSVQNQQKRRQSEVTDFIEVVDFDQVNVPLCAIWYHLYNLKNVKKTHGGVLFREVAG